MNANAPRPPQESLHPHYTAHFGGTFMHVMGNYNHYRGGTVKGGFELLQDACAPSAFHNSGEGHVHPPCHPNTQVAILRTIMDGIRGQRVTEDGVTTAMPKRFIIFTGPAGAGKSAIASTIAGRCYEEGRLLASFFFRSSDPSRNHSRQFFPTIAYQICIALPQVRNYIAAVIDRDPLILRKSLSIQLDSLLINPLLHLMNSGMLDATGRYCIIIDGLDECVDKEKKARCELLEILMSGITRTPLPLVFFIASRPEYDITSVISSKNLAHISTRLYLDTKWDDIRTYLRDNFSTIRKTHPSGTAIPLNWPSSVSLNALVDKASGQFIYAATVVKYVSSDKRNPMKRLELVLASNENHTDTSPFAELDTLYMQILTEIEDHDVKTLLRILSYYHLMTNAWTRDCRLPIWILGYTETMFQTQTMVLLPMLRSNLASLVTVKIKDERYPDGVKRATFSLHVNHASFTDFLSDRRRSGKYYMDLCWWREEHISTIFRYFENLLRCKNETIIESCTIVVALPFIEDNLAHTSIKTVCNDLSHFSIEDLHEIIFDPCYNDDSHFGFFSYVLCSILCELKGLPSSPERDAVHSTFSQVLDKYLRDRLWVYRLNPRLQCFMTILPYVTRCSKARMRCIRQVDVLGNVLWIGLKDPRTKSLHSNLYYGDDDMFGAARKRKLMAFTADFLVDPARVGPSALWGMDYVQMALQSLDLLCNTTFLEQQHPSSYDLARTRRNKPFLSRHKRDFLYRLYRLTRVEYSRSRLLEICDPTICDQIWEPTEPYDYPDSEFSSFRKCMKRQIKAFKRILLVGLALCYLPYLLKHSCKHEELEVRLRQMVFPPYAFRHPKKLALVQKAIAKYVQGKYPAYYEETRAQIGASIIRPRRPQYLTGEVGRLN